MRKLIFVLVLVLGVLLVASAAVLAQTVLLTEDFEGVTGADISTLGWTQTESGPAITISNTVIDSGKSAVVEEADWEAQASVYKKDIAASLGASDELVLTATVHVYPESFISDEAGIYLSTPKGIYYLAVFKANEDGQAPVRQWKIRTPTQMYPTMITPDLPTSGGNEVKAYDLKIVLTSVRAIFYGKVHGASQWVQLYDTSGASSISDVTIWMQNLNYDDPPGEPPYIDSINLVKNAAITDNDPEYLYWESFIGTDATPLSDLGWTFTSGAASITNQHIVSANLGQAAVGGSGTAWTAGYKELDSPITLEEGDVIVMTGSTYAWSNHDCDNLAMFGVGTDIGSVKFGMHSPPRVKITPETDPVTWEPTISKFRYTIAGVGSNQEIAINDYAAAMDVKMELTKRTVRFYTRVHGTADWTEVYYRQSLNISVISRIEIEYYNSNWSWPDWWYYPRLDEVNMKLYKETIDPSSIVFADDFESYTAGVDIASPGGWQKTSGSCNIVGVAAQRDGTSIDFGKMVRVGTQCWPGTAYERELLLPVQIDSGQDVTTQAVVYAVPYTDCQDDAGIQVADAVGNVWQMRLVTKKSGDDLAYSYWSMKGPGGWQANSPTVTPGTWDVKIVVSPTGSEFFARLHGTPLWQMFATNNLGASSLSKVGIFLHCNNWSPGWWEYAYLDSLITYGGNGAAGQTPDAVSIVNAKKLADDTLISCSGTVTAVFGDSFYIEDADRVSGIRVTKAGHGLQAGDGAQVIGKMGTLANTERFVDATVINEAEAAVITPLGMINKVIGGELVTDAEGLTNVGLLIRTTGVVGASGEANSFALDDGSGVPLRAFMPNGGAAPDNGKYVAVTGISSVDKSGDALTRMLQVVSYDVLK